MRLKVLGSGSKGNCYLLQNEEETLILECGIPYKNILKGLNFNLNNVIGCLATHEHKDHVKATQDLIKAGIDAYMSQGTAEAIGAEGYRVKHIKSEKQFTAGNFTILPFQVEHDAAEPLGFLLQHKNMGKLLYITDSYYCRYQFKGLQHILIECNYSQDILDKNFQEGLIPISLRNRVVKSHFSLENVKEFLKAIDLKSVEEIVLIHLSESNSNVDYFKTEIEKITGKPTYVAEKNTELLFKGR